MDSVPVDTLEYVQDEGVQDDKDDATRMLSRKRLMMFMKKKGMATMTRPQQVIKK